MTPPTGNQDAADKQLKAVLQILANFKEGDGDYQYAADKIMSLIAQHDSEVERRARIEIGVAFVREFCNDHNVEVRWLRGVALDEEHLLELILEFFNKQANQPLAQLQPSAPGDTMTNGGREE